MNLYYAKYGECANVKYIYVLAKNDNGNLGKIAKLCKRLALETRSITPTVNSIIFIASDNSSGNRLFVLEQDPSRQKVFKFDEGNGNERDYYIANDEIDICEHLDKQGACRVVIEKRSENLHIVD